MKQVNILIFYSLIGMFFCSASDDLFDDSRGMKIETQNYKHFPIYSDLQENKDMRFNPIDLVSAWRFDIMAKYIYAKHRELGVKNDWAKKIYSEHLHVWGNYKESWPKKDGLEEYLNAFHAILSSIKNEGFSTKYSVVPIDSRKLISNGGHRVAASLLYGKEVVCKYYSQWQAPIATAEFFRKNQKHVKGGLPEKYLDAMALEYAALRSNTFIAHIFPIAAGKDAELKEILDEYGVIVYEKKVFLHHHGPLNFIKLIYQGEPWIGNYGNDFAGARRDSKTRFSNAKQPMRVLLFECKSLELVRECKAKIRALFGLGNFSIHINDTHEDTIRLSQVLFNENSIHVLNFAKTAQMKNFEQYFNEYKLWLKSKGFEKENFCVDSSAVLSVYGIRDCRDLDFLHHGSELKNYATRASNVSSHNESLGHHVYSLDDIIYNPENHFYYGGVKFSALHVVKGMKKKRNEEKDRKDLALIDKHFKVFKRSASVNE
jgi:hypothetical protein